MPLLGECPDFNVVTVEVLESLLKEMDGLEDEPSTLEESCTVFTSLLYQLVDVSLSPALLVGVLTLYLNKVSIMFQEVIEDECRVMVCEN